MMIIKSALFSFILTFIFFYAAYGSENGLGLSSHPPKKNRKKVGIERLEDPPEDNDDDYTCMYSYSFLIVNLICYSHLA